MRTPYIYRQCTRMVTILDNDGLRNRTHLVLSTGHWPSNRTTNTQVCTSTNRARFCHTELKLLFVVGLGCGGKNARPCRGQPPTAPDRMNAKTRGKMWQNSPPPQESTSPPARSIASQRGSADRTKSSAVVASTSSTAHTPAMISRRESAGRSASESRSTVKRYAHPAASVLIYRGQGRAPWARLEISAVPA